MKQAFFGEQGCSLRRNATVYMRLANTHVIPREQSTDRAYQNCFWPLAWQKLWNDTMTCTQQLVGLAEREVADDLRTATFGQHNSPAHCAARYAQKAYLTKDILGKLVGVRNCAKLAAQKDS